MMRERPLRPFALLLIAGLSLAAVVHRAVGGGVGLRPGVQRGRRRDGAGLRRRVWEGVAASAPRGRSDSTTPLRGIGRRDVEPWALEIPNGQDTGCQLVFGYKWPMKQTQVRRRMVADAAKVLDCGERTVADGPVRAPRRPVDHAI